MTLFLMRSLLLGCSSVSLLGQNESVLSPKNWRKCLSCANDDKFLSFVGRNMLRRKSGVVKYNTPIFSHAVMEKINTPAKYYCDKIGTFCSVDKSSLTNILLH